MQITANCTKDGNVNSESVKQVIRLYMGEEEIAIAGEVGMFFIIDRNLYKLMWKCA